MIRNFELALNPGSSLNEVECVGREKRSSSGRRGNCSSCLRCSVSRLIGRSIESRGGIGGTPASYKRGPGLKSRPEDL